MLIVENTTKDPRFSDNPKVVQGGLRFYAGVPLQAAEGENIGSLCIRDTRPRRLNDAKRESLRDLAKWAQFELNAGQCERALELSRERWHQLHDAITKAPVSTILHSEDGQILLVSETWTALSGYTLKEIPDIETWRRKSSAKSYSKTDAKLFPAEAYTGQERYHAGEFIIQTKNGQQQIWDFHTSPLGSLPDGRSFAKTVALDVTAERQREEELQQRSEEWRNTFDAIPDPVTIMDKDFRIVQANQAMLECLQKSSEEIVGKLCHELVHGKCDPPDICPHSKLQQDEQHHFAEMEIGNFGGTFLVSVAPLFDNNGEIRGAVHIAKDITELKQTQTALTEAKNEAQAANQAKTEFLANMSHELRTPLNSVIGFGDLLKEKTFGDLNEKQTKYVENITKSARHLLDLLNDVLDLSKIEADKMTLNHTKIEIKPFLENTVDMLQQKAVEHGLQMHLDIAEEIAALSIRADERKLRQVMFNLLSNATKFTPDGGSITVTADSIQAKTHEGESARKMLRISVADTGVGITPENQEHIFERFSQLESGEDRQYQGTGLGLALTKRLVELHDGCIFVESKGEGKGTTFTFQIPLNPGN